MAFITDFTLINNAATTGDWTASGFDSPTLNDSAATTPIYIEGSACMWWPLKKGTTDGYVYETTTNISITNRVLVALLNYPFADIGNIPITSLTLEASSGTFESSNYAEWDALAQLYSPYNVPISGHTPIMGYPDAATEVGTPDYGGLDEFGWVATTGNDADGKQGGFDFFFAIGWIGEHSETFTNTFFDDLYEEAYDNDGGGLPDTTSRPLCIISRSGDFFQTNVRIQLGDGTADTANLVVSETGKTVFFSNLHVNHELGYVFVDPNGANEVRLTLTDCVHFWTDQAAANEIFTDPENATYFKIDGCSFSNGGIFESPPDSANRWIRNSKFNNCQTGVISDGEFTDNIVNGCYTVAVSGDADLTGTQILNSAVAADASALEWNGTTDPNGNLDGMVFSKGTNAHHAIELGNTIPSEITLTNIDFSGFNAANAQNDSTLYFADTGGTITVNLVGCTGNISYKSAGATIILVSNPVTLTVTARNINDDSLIEGAKVTVWATFIGSLPYNAPVTITRVGSVATVAHTSHGMSTGHWVEIAGANQNEYNRLRQITKINDNSYSYTVQGTPTTPATGTITATAVIINGLTNASGVISDTRSHALDQDYQGKGLKGTSPPVYKEAPLSGTIDKDTGATNTILMIPD